MLDRITLFLFILKLIDKTFSFGLGVDFGSQYHKASMLLPKKYFTMVEDSISKRKTPTLMTLCNDKRFFEYQGLSKFSKKKCDSLFYLNRFFEEPDSPSRIIHEQNKNIFRDKSEISRDDIGDLFSIKTKNFPQIAKLEEYSRNAPEDLLNIRFEEIYAMLLSNMKINAERTAGREFKQVVFTIQDNGLSILTRKRLKSALKLAGFTTSAFIHENTAAAVYNAVNKKYSDPNLDLNMIIVNIGSLGTKISLVNTKNIKKNPNDENSEFYPQVTNLHDFYSPEFSGYLMDYCFSNYALNKHFKKSSNFDSVQELNDVKMKKLILNVRKPKEILSVNRSSKVHIENFFNDLPLSVKVMRSEYEIACENVFKKLEPVLRSFDKKLKKNGFGQEIHQIQIIGGVVRTPKVQEIIKAHFSAPVGTHINGDDGPALGAAFMAANYSAGIKVKDLIVLDGPDYEVELTINKPDVTVIDKMMIYPKKTVYGTKSKFSLPDLVDDLEIELASPSQNYSLKYNVTGTEGLEERFENKTISSWNGFMEFELNKLGIPILDTAYIMINETFIERVNVTRPKNSSNETSTQTEETEVKLDTQPETEPVVLENQIDSNSTANATNSTKNETKPKIEYEVVEEERVKHKMHRIRLIIKKVFENQESLEDIKEEFRKSQSLIRKLKKYDKNKKDFGMKKNELESYIYKLKQNTEDEDSKKYLKDSEIEQYLLKSQEIDDYMFSDEIDTANITSIKDKIKEVENLIYPFRVRKEEFKIRNQVYNISMTSFVNYTMALNETATQKPWIEKEKFTEIEELMNNTKLNLEDLYTQQLELALNEDPVFNLTFAKSETKKIEDKILKLRKITKPKNDTDTVEDFANLDLDELKNFDPNNFDFSKMNMTMEKLREMMDGLKDLQGKMNVPGMEENLKDLEEKAKKAEDVLKQTIPENNQEQPDQVNDQPEEVQTEQQIEPEEELIDEVTTDM